MSDRITIGSVAAALSATAQLVCEVFGREDAGRLPLGRRDLILRRLRALSHLFLFVAEPLDRTAIAAEIHLMCDRDETRSRNPELIRIVERALEDFLAATAPRGTTNS